MKFIATFLFSALFTLVIQAASIEGDIKLNYSSSGFKEEWTSEDGFGYVGFNKQFGDVVKATCNWYAGNFLGKETIIAGATVKNTGTKPMVFHYYVAFYDKHKKLVGAVGQDSFDDNGLKPGEEEQLGSCLIFLPKGKYKEITSYQAVIYETDIAPKK